MPTYETPKVYFERSDAAAPAISAIRTDIAGFVGIAERGPIGTPLPVESWRQFQAHFGGCIPAGYLAYAIRGFFENGGRRCWVVRVASGEPLASARAAELIVQDKAGKDAKDVWKIKASSPGAWGNDLSIVLQETRRLQTVTESSGNAPHASKVRSIGGFKRGTLVRLSQPGAPEVFKIVSDVDGQERLLVWESEKPENRLCYDSPLIGFDPNGPLRIESVEYSLLVAEKGRTIAFYEGLSLVPEHPRYGPNILSPTIISKDHAARGMIPAAPQPIVIEELRSLDGLNKSRPEFLTSLAMDSGQIRKAANLANGTDGLSLLRADDFIGQEASFMDSEEESRAKLRGIRALSTIDEISIVAVPDIHIQPKPLLKTSPRKPCKPDPCLHSDYAPPAEPAQPAEPELPPVFPEQDIYRVQAALVQHCEEQRDRIALLDPPLSAALDDLLGVSAIQAWRSRFDSKYAALYHPWLRIVDPLQSASSLTRDLPPCGHVAGQYARNDLETGVHKAPANKPIEWASGVTLTMHDAVHGMLNIAGINVLRTLPGRGIRILGARTLSSDPDWRYVNVRRLLMMIEKAIDYATQWATFEPNNLYTRAKITLSLTSFLEALWRQGALVGAERKEAFFVKCDEENNPPRERDNGRLLAEIGVAPSKPWEFIVIRIGRAGNALEMSEYSLSKGGI